MVAPFYKNHNEALTFHTQNNDNETLVCHREGATDSMWPLSMLTPRQLTFSES